MLFLSELNCMGYWSLDSAWEYYYGGAECVILYFNSSLTGPFVSMVRLFLVHRATLLLEVLGVQAGLAGFLMNLLGTKQEV